MTDIEALIFSTIDEVNGQLPPEGKLAKSADTVIVGEEGVLDSLGVINFLVSLEEKVAAATGQPVALLRDDIMEEGNTVLHTVASINRYINENL
mgnify:CR=1 FL=1